MNETAFVALNCYKFQGFGFILFILFIGQKEKLGIIPLHKRIF